MTCRDCKLFDLDAVKDKAGRVRKNKAAKCLWVSKETYPSSVFYPQRVNAGHMTSDSGERCPCFQKR